MPQNSSDGFVSSYVCCVRRGKLSVMKFCRFVHVNAFLRLLIYRLSARVWVLVHVNHKEPR